MKRILISGYLGFDNFGDEALLFVLIQNLLKSGQKKKDITIISNNSNATSNTYDINSINRWNLFDLLTSLFMHDVLIFIGGIFQDKTSFKSFLYYFLQLILARLFQKEIVFWGAGIGPFQRKISQVLFNYGLDKIQLLTVRDKASALLTPYGENTPVTCDPVWSIEPVFTFQNKIPNINWQLPIIGISMRLDKNLKRKNIIDIVDKVAKVLTSMKDWQVLLIPCMLKEDLPILHEVYDLISKRAHADTRIAFLQNFNQFSIQEQAGILASCDVMIGMRYHALLVPLANSKPVFGLIYDGKVKSLLEFAGQVGVSFKDNFDQPWSYFWQNLEQSSYKAKEASEKAKQLHKKNIEILERLI